MRENKWRFTLLWSPTKDWVALLVVTLLVLGIGVISRKQDEALSLMCTTLGAGLLGGVMTYASQKRTEKEKREYIATQQKEFLKLNLYELVRAYRELYYKLYKLSSEDLLKSDRQVMFPTLDLNLIAPICNRLTSMQMEGVNNSLNIIAICRIEYNEPVSIVLEKSELKYSLQSHLYGVDDYKYNLMSIIFILYELISLLVDEKGLYRGHFENVTSADKANQFEEDLLTKRVPKDIIQFYTDLKLSNT